ncbi:unnamed protein product [Closterium sp. Naga37s-1]|nr:unnamed protein product [Closterium sp. Naga37s-1]
MPLLPCWHHSSPSKPLSLPPPRPSGALLNPGGTASCPFCILERRIARSLTLEAARDTPRVVVNRLKLIAKSFSHGRQEDAHELLRYAIEACNRACVALHKKVAAAAAAAAASAAAITASGPNGSPDVTKSGPVRALNQLVEGMSLNEGASVQKMHTRRSSRLSLDRANSGRDSAEGVPFPQQQLATEQESMQLGELTGSEGSLVPQLGDPVENTDMDVDADTNVDADVTEVPEPSAASASGPATGSSSAAAVADEADVAAAGSSSSGGGSVPRRRMSLRRRGFATDGEEEEDRDGGFGHAGSGAGAGRGVGGGRARKGRGVALRVGLHVLPGRGKGRGAGAAGAAAGAAADQIGSPGKSPGRSKGSPRGAGGLGGGAAGGGGAGEGGAGGCSGGQDEPHTIVKEIFGGILQSQIRCLQCDGESNKRDAILDLSLDVHRLGSLKDALNRFTKPEVLDGENRYRCDKCNRLSAARKALTIFHAPNILVIQFKRFENVFGGKIDRHIRFEERVSLKGHMSGCSKVGSSRWGTVASKDSQPEYTLFGVVVHAGSSQDSGHYYAYVKYSTASGPADSICKWSCCDDGTVSPVAFLSGNTAYMILYLFPSFSLRPPFRPPLQDSTGRWSCDDCSVSPVAFPDDSTGKWSCCDDCSVSPVALPDVLADKAYMLFYLRLSPLASLSLPLPPPFSLLFLPVLSLTPLASGPALTIVPSPQWLSQTTPQADGPAVTTAPSPQWPSQTF